MAETLPFDSNLAQSDRAGWNAGCPLGYFAQFVAPDAVDAGVIPPGFLGASGGSGIRCRLMATSSAATIQSESGTSTDETLQIFTDAVQDTAHQILPGLGLGLGIALLVGGFLLFRGR